uniref:Uncharacterized protein n=1 Tax=Oryza glaberrima TaxID=4538 RepID=I1PBE2_ORYGL
MGLPSSGGPAHNASLGPARTRTSSLFARRAGDPSAAIAGFQRRLYGGHRRPDVPLAGGSLADSYAERRVEIPKSFVILEDILQHTLSNMHSIQESILFWQSNALRTNSQKAYFMIFQRGPRAFVATTCQTLAKLQNKGSPVQGLLDSASSMFSTKLAILTRMQHCLASFLAEVYNETDKRRSVLIRRSEQSLHSLFVALNNIFSNLEVELRNAGEPGAVLANHDNNSFELFQRLPEADVQSSAAISLIYENLQKLDIFLSSQKAEKNDQILVTLHIWSIGPSAFTLWLLRHSSLMGSSDIDNWLHGAKKLLVWCWDENVQKPVSSIRYLTNTLQQSKGVTGKQYIQFPEDTLSKCRNISSSLCERYEMEPGSPEELACLMINQAFFSPTLKFQTKKFLWDFKEVMPELEHVLRVQQVTLAFGRWLLLPVLLKPARVVHGQVTQRRGRIAHLKRCQLLSRVQEMLAEFQYCMDKGMKEEAQCSLGLLLYSIYRFYRGVESSSKETGEWIYMKEHIFCLADPQLGVAIKRDILSSLRNYKCLSPPSSLYGF